VEAAKARGNPGSWVTNADYPDAAIRSGESGVTGFRLDIGADGRVTDCTITQSSGSSLLDNTACRLLTRRAKFSPARDTSGNPTTDSFSSRFRWVLPEE
jgi:protein TonB